MAELAFLLVVAYHWLCYMKGEAMELCRCMLCYGPSICTQAQAHQKERSDKACGEKEHPSCTFSSLGLLLDAEVQEHMQKHRVEVKAYVTIYTSGRCIQFCLTGMPAVISMLAYFHQTVKKTNDFLDGILFS